MADVNGISDLLKQIAYYQSGGTAPGQSLADKMGRVQDIASGYEHDVKDIGDIVKQRLEAKQLKLGQTPYYKFDQSLPQDPGVVDKAQADSDLAQKNYTQAFQAQRDTAGTAPDPGQQPTAYANPYAAFEKAQGFNPRLPLSTIKEVAQAKALSQPGTTLYINPDTKETSWQVKPGFTMSTTVPVKNVANIAVKQEEANAPVAVTSTEDALKAGHVKKGTIIKSAAESADLTPESIDMLAERFLAGMQDPMGLGKQTRTSMFNRAAEIAKSRGDTVAMQMIRRAEVKANQAELTGLQKSRGQIMAFEKTAKANLQNFLQTIDAIPDAGSPLLNTPLRQLALKGGGSPEVAAFLTAHHVASQEIARVLQGNLSGAVTDNARKEASDLLSGDYTANQFKAAASILLNDMENRNQGFGQQIGETKTNIGNVAGGASPQTAPPATTGGAFEKSMSDAKAAIGAGADKTAVRLRLLKKYPGQAGQINTGLQ